MPPNSKSLRPYSVHQDEAGYHYFLTDQDLLYACKFDDLTPYLTPLVGIYDIHISDFSFAPQSGESKVHDPRISPTIVGLLQGYFQDESNVLVYLCDASDGRPRERQALYKRWHRNMADMVDHEPVEFAVQDAVIYGGIFTRKDFPYQDTMHEQLRGRAAKIIGEKFVR